MTCVPRSPPPHEVVASAPTHADEWFQSPGPTLCDELRQPVSNRARLEARSRSQSLGAFEPGSGSLGSQGMWLKGVLEDSWAHPLARTREVGRR